MKKFDSKDETDYRWMDHRMVYMDGKKKKQQPVFVMACLCCRSGKSRTILGKTKQSEYRCVTDDQAA